MKSITAIREQWESIRGDMTERLQRQWAATEALALGVGGRAAVVAATGLAPSTIGHGINEIRSLRAGRTAGLVVAPERSRRPGGGRKSLLVKQPTLLSALDGIISPEARGDPEAPLRWTAKSKEALARELVAQGFQVSPMSVKMLLGKLGYSLQGNAKVLEGRNHPDRDAQFRYINQQVQEHKEAGEPATSVDTKKKEIVGNYKNRGRELRPKGCPEKGDVNDFIGELGRASPYGVYDILANLAWVSVGITADTSEFAVATLRKWWEELGRQRYPQARRLLVTADCHGSNGYRVRLWKVELQKFADDASLEVTVCHLPPGTSKWNRIEHALFSFISQNWRGQPLVDYQTIVRLIGATTTQQGLVVRCALDEHVYERDTTVSDAELAAVNLRAHDFHGEWNYTIAPRPPAVVGSS